MIYIAQQVGHQKHQKQQWCGSFAIVIGFVNWWFFFWVIFFCLNIRINHWSIWLSFRRLFFPNCYFIYDCGKFSWRKFLSLHKSLLVFFSLLSFYQFCLFLFGIPSSQLWLLRALCIYQKVLIPDWLSVLFFLVSVSPIDSRGIIISHYLRYIISKLEN